MVTQSDITLKDRVRAPFLVFTGTALGFALTTFGVFNYMLPNIRQSAFEKGYAEAVKKNTISHINVFDRNSDGTNEVVVVYDDGSNINYKDFIANQFKPSYGPLGEVQTGLEGDFISPQKAKAYELAQVEQRTSERRKELEQELSAETYRQRNDLETKYYPFEANLR